MKKCRSLGRWPGAALLLAVSLLIAGGATVATAGPSYVPNEFIIKAAPGSSVTTVEQAIDKMGGELVKPIPLTDMYLVRLGTGSVQGGTLKKRLSVSTPRAVVVSYSANYVKKSAATPNDPDFDLQWGLGLINMPQAWAIQKGSAAVTVAVLDSGVANHPELLGRLVAGYDFVDNDADPSNDTDGHGTFCAGEIAAQGDNSVGVCGVCWDGVNIMPIRVLGPGGGTTADCVAGMDWAMQNHANVMSMSYGGSAGVPDPVEQAKVTEVASHNIIMVAAAGNDGEYANPSVESPALCPEVIAVGAVGPNDEIAPYSSYGPGYEVDITAPGGDSRLGQQATIYGLSVFWDPVQSIFDYTYEEGTSMACPMVSGAAALLLSAGVPPGEVRTQLETSARAPRGVIGTIDKRKYGAGILDVSSALSNGSVLIAKPIKGSTTGDVPDFKINVRGIDPNSLAIYLDYADSNNDGLPDDLSAEPAVLSGRDAIDYLNTAQTSYTFNWSDISSTPLETGFHLLYVKATTSTGAAEVSDWGTFTVASRVIPAGTYLMSLPYAGTISQADGLRHPLPQELLLDASTSQPLEFRPTVPGRARLIRWSPVDISYLEYLPLSDGFPAPNDRSWNNIISPRFNVATGGGFMEVNPSTLTFPAGSGFWLILQRDAVISNAYDDIDAPAGYNIPLRIGWNLIGNPFTHDIAVDTILLRYQGKIRTLYDDSRLPVYSRWVDPLLYGYSNEGIGGYVPVRARDVLKAYQGYWIRARVGGTQPTDQLLMFVQ